MSAEKFNPTVSQIRECRSLLLDFINSVYPSGLAEEELLYVMLNLPASVAEDYVRRDLGYLQGRGLIAPLVEDHPVRRAKVKRWRMTADGVTFVERNKPWAEIERL